jgi:hypothetical protein
MKAQDKFELLAPRYRKAYFENNGLSVNVSYYNGYVLVGTSKYRVSKFEQMTKNLEDRLIEKQQEVNWEELENSGLDKPFKLIEEPKQETVEEVVERLYPFEVGYGVFDRNWEIDIERERFIEGAKWQAERIKEDMWEAYKQSNTVFDDEVALRTEFEKWFEQFKKNK